MTGPIAAGGAIGIFTIRKQIYDLLYDRVRLRLFRISRAAPLAANAMIVVSKAFRRVSLTLAKGRLPDIQHEQDANQRGSDPDPR